LRDGGGVTPLAERGRIARDVFDREVRAGGEPVVLRGQVAHWPVVAAARAGDQNWADYLRRHARAAPVGVMIGPPEIGGRFGYAPGLSGLNFQRTTAELMRVVDQLVAGRAASRPPAVAVQSAPIPDALPGFDRANALDLVPTAVVPRAWIGNAVTVAIHHDAQENVACVVAGRRRFALFPPEQAGNLYLGPLEFTPAGVQVSTVDPSDPDLSRHPRFARALEAARTAELEPGDAIYIPFHWWHHVESLSPVNMLVNYWWDPVASPDQPRDALLHALLAIRDLPADQRRGWRALFDAFVFSGDEPHHLPTSARGVLGPAAPERSAAIRRMLAGVLRRYGAGG
jgi:oxalate decarboxylase/phosphoglucose isomerase-like protein (cupin superfamily)